MCLCVQGGEGRATFIFPELTEAGSTHLSQSLYTQTYWTSVSPLIGVDRTLPRTHLA